LLALSLSTILITWWAQQTGGAMAHLGELSLRARISQALLASGSYLRDAFWPSGLAMPYPHPGEVATLAAAAAIGAALAAFSLVVWHQRRARPHLAVGWLWFLGMLVPVLGLVPMGYAARADRYTYLPLTGLAIAVAWSVPRALLRTGNGRRGVVAVAGAVLLGLAFVAHAQVGYWRDTFQLMHRALAVTGDNSVAHLILARAHARTRDVDSARPHFEAVFRLEPTAQLPVFEWAYLLDRTGAPEEALEAYQRGVALGPGFGLGQEALAFALERQGRLEEALEHYTRGGPASALALRGRARMAQQLGRHEEALSARRRLVETRPGEAAPAAELAFALATCPDAALRDPAAALAVIEPVAAQHPEDPIVLDALAAALAAAGQTKAASDIAERALTRSNEPLAGGIRERLGRYREGLAYIDRR
jgi:protein O-mannosyl-transferase